MTERFQLHHGDSREVLRTLAENSVDSIVCDPPYELGFMGKGWDSTGVANDPALWVAALRVLKPGGHLLAFSGTRTYHRMVCAIEDAGFEIRDQIGWVYGSGFPKSHNGEWGGTALKPAWEPIVMARKPLIGTVEENWREHGTGALNIDGCRIETGESLNGGAYAASGGRAQLAGDERTGAAAGMFQPGKTAGSEFVQPEGRWPANLIHDGSDEVLAHFPQSNGQQGAVTGEEPSSKTNAVYGEFNGRPATVPRGDDGSAARFFYCAKAGVEDRNEGCFGLPEKVGGMVSNTSGQHMTRRDGGAPGPRANHHPTVKPTDLMRYLCRLVTPKGGLVLDPFMGSGSTGKAAMLEGFRFTGIDMTPEYVEIARARIDFALRQGHQPSLLEFA
jgi:site-specific DNA-methyltransferase (adenine-specific)